MRYALRRTRDTDSAIFANDCLNFYFREKGVAVKEFCKQYKEITGRRPTARQIANVGNGRSANGRGRKSMVWFNVCPII